MCSKLTVKVSERRCSCVFIFSIRHIQPSVFISNFEHVTGRWICSFFISFSFSQYIEREMDPLTTAAAAATSIDKLMKLLPKDKEKTELVVTQNPEKVSLT